MSHSFLACLLLFFPPFCHCGLLSATDLRVEKLPSPVYGVDNLQPLFSWLPTATPELRGIAPGGYRLMVLDSLGGAVWDSGAVNCSSGNSSSTVGDARNSSRYRLTPSSCFSTRPPAGALAYDELYSWSVVWQDETGAQAPASPSATFHTGLSAGTWVAQTQWLTCASVGACDYLRSPVLQVPAGSVVARATLHLATAGWTVAYVNGQRVGGNVALEGAWTQWNVRLPSTAYNVTGLVTPGGGGNAVGLVLGNGWWGHLGHRASASALLSVVLGSGERLLMGSSSGSWLGSSGPITGDDIYLGESYDMGREVPGWSTPGADLTGWDATAVPAKEPYLASAARSWQAVQPVVARRAPEQLLPAVSVAAPNPHQFVVDFALNSAGWTQLRLPPSCPKGTTLLLRHAENLQADGTVDQGNLRSAKATEALTCDGRPSPFVYEPTFTYHGFRYVGVEGWPGSGEGGFPTAPTPGLFFKVEAHTAVEWPVGGATTQQPPPSWLTFGGSTVLPEVHGLIQRGQLSNLHGGVPTDCCQRDERQGWMADASVSAESALCSWDMGALYAQWLRTITDSQASAEAMGDCEKGSPLYPDCTGATTDTSPHVPGLFGTRPADPSWGAALDIVYDLLLRYHYDLELARGLYPSLAAYAGFLMRVAATPSQQGLVTFHNYGDWLQPNQVASTEGVSQQTTAFSYLKTLRAAITAATVLGQAGDVARFTAAYTTGAAAYNGRWFNVSGSGCWGGGRQNEQVFPLFLGLQPGGDGALEAMVQHCLLPAIAANGTHVDTGIISTKYLMPLLSRAGQGGLALQLALQTDFPSWGAMARVFNQSTITEHWDCLHNPSGNAMSSRNHPALGSVGSWLYGGVLGVRVGDEASAEWSAPGLPPNGGGGGGGVAEGMGWARALVAPEVVTNSALPSAAGGVRGARGTVSASWAFDGVGGPRLTLNVTFPVGVAGEVRTPLQAPWGVGNATVREVLGCGGGLVWDKGAFVPGCSGVTGGRACGRGDARVCLDMGSGMYAFVVE